VRGRENSPRGPPLVGDAVQELAIAQRHTEEALTRLTERMERGFAETAMPVAAGQEWPPNVQDEARREAVAIVQDGIVNQGSWEAALARA
jgi:hypothetical protein